MFKTLITALRLIWISATDKDLKLRLTFSYIFGVVQGIIAFFSPFALSEMIKQISQKNIDGTLFYFYVMIFLAVVTIVSRFVWRFFVNKLRVYCQLNSVRFITEKYLISLMTGIYKTVSVILPPL